MEKNKHCRTQLAVLSGEDFLLNYYVQYISMINFSLFRFRIITSPRNLLTRARKFSDIHCERINCVKLSFEMFIGKLPSSRLRKVLIVDSLRLKTRKLFSFHLTNNSLTKERGGGDKRRRKCSSMKQHKCRFIAEESQIAINNKFMYFSFHSLRFNLFAVVTNTTSQLLLIITL